MCSSSKRGICLSDLNSRHPSHPSHPCVSISFFADGRRFPRTGPDASYHLSLRLHGGPDGISAFFIELALPTPSPLDCLASPGWPGQLACTTDDPVGLIRIAGTCTCNATDIFEILTLTWPALDTAPATLAYARVETIGPAHHTTLYSIAGRFGSTPLPLPSVPPAPLVDLATAWRLSGPESLAACMVLTERLRVIAGTMLYATDTELTLMIRLTDRRGKPDLTRSILYLYLTPLSLPEWAQIASVWQAVPADPWYISAPVYNEDGWYGFEYRGPLPNQSVALSLYHATLGPTLNPQPARARVFGTIPPQLAPTDFASGSPYTTLQLGRHAPHCPWDARAPAALVLTFTAQLPSSLHVSFAQLQDAARVLGCNISVPARRIALSVTGAGLLTVTIQLESFLRAYDVRLALSDPARLLALLPYLTLPPSGLRSLAASYSPDPADPPTACPAGYYFTDAGTYRPTPRHAAVGPDCYGFSCHPGYTLDPHAVLCVPEYVADWIFWTVVCLVSTMAFAVVLCACTLRLLCARQPFEPEPEPVPSPKSVPDNTLPVSVTPDGNLLFEAVISSESSCSDSESEQENTGAYAELVSDTENENAQFIQKLHE